MFGPCGSTKCVCRATAGFFQPVTAWHLQTRLMNIMLGDAPVPGRLSSALVPKIFKTLAFAPASSRAMRG